MVERKNTMTMNKSGSEVPGTGAASGHFGISDIFASGNAPQEEAKAPVK